MLSETLLPNEMSERVQGILHSNTSIEEKAKEVYRYATFLCDMADRRRKPPKMSLNIITKVLEARAEEEGIGPLPHIEFF